MTAEHVVFWKHFLAAEHVELNVGNIENKATW